MRSKYIIISKAEISKKLEAANLFVNSLCPHKLVINEFNSLSKNSRKKIIQLFDIYDDIRRKKIPKDENNNAWLTGIMVDANIIATEFNIDPLTAILCLNSLCKSNERIIVK